MPNKVHASGFAAVPYALLEQAPDSFVVHVYAVLHRHGWASKQGAWLSIETIRRQTGISARSIRRSLGWLKDTGWVDAVPRLGETTVYHVRVDAPALRTPWSGDGERADTPLRKRTRRENATYDENARGPLAKTPGDPLQKRQSNKNPRTRTQEQEPNKRGSIKKTEEKDPLRLKRLPLDAVPIDLLSCADLLVEFWSVKKGTRSTPVFNRVTKKLLSWTPAERQEALERAIAAGWGDVFQPQPRTAGKAPWAPPELKHPAAREFRNGRFVDEDGPTTNPALEGLF